MSTLLYHPHEPYNPQRSYPSSNARAFPFQSSDTYTTFFCTLSTLPLTCLYDSLILFFTIIIQHFILYSIVFFQQITINNYKYTINTQLFFHIITCYLLLSLCSCALCTCVLMQLFPYPLTALSLRSLS